MPEAMWDAIGPALPWIAIASIFVAIGYFQHKEKMRKLDNLHQERLRAIEKGLPPPEMPTETSVWTPPPRKPMPNAALATGISLAGGALGVMGVFYMTLPIEAHQFWILPLPVLLVGFGLMLFHFLKNDGFNRFD